MFKVTNQWLDEHRTKYGGWTDAQWEAIGATRKLRKLAGWKKHLVGGWITYGQKGAFEQAKDTYSKNTLRQRKLKKNERGMT